MRFCRSKSDKVLIWRKKKDGRHDQDIFKNFLRKWCSLGINTCIQYVEHQMNRKRRYQGDRVCMRRWPCATAAGGRNRTKTISAPPPPLHPCEVLRPPPPPSLPLHPNVWSSQMWTNWLSRLILDTAEIQKKTGSRKRYKTILFQMAWKNGTSIDKACYRRMDSYTIVLHYIPYN